MPIVMEMHWPEATKSHYDAARNQVNWENDKAAGGIFHVSWWEDDGMHIIDVWESSEDFERFASERLMPGIAAIGGIPGEPNVVHHAVHAYTTGGAFAAA